VVRGTGTEAQSTQGAVYIIHRSLQRPDSDACDPAARRRDRRGVYARMYVCMQLRGTHRAGLRSYHPLSLRAAASSSSPSLLRPHPYRYNIRPRPRNKTLYRNIAPPVGDLPLSAPTLTLTPPRVYRRLPLDKALLRELGHEGVQVRDLLPAATHGRLLNLYRTNLCVGRGRVWGVECKAQSSGSAVVNTTFGLGVGV